MLQNYFQHSRLFALACQEACKTACWNCHHKPKHSHGELFCESCHSIQDPSCENFFQLFHQPKKFDIDINKLDKMYQGLQRKVHPDRFYRKTEKEREISMKASGCINEGYHTLRSPISRGEYLLKIFGEKIVTEVPQEFLIDVIDLHEQINEAQDPAECVKLLKQIQELIKVEKDKLAEYFVVENDKIKYPNEGGETLAKLKYLSRLRDTIRQKIPVNML